MSEGSDVRKILDAELRRLARAFDQLVDTLDEAGGPDIDVMLADGKIVVEFEDGVKFIINRQSGNDQIWVAEPNRGWHYGWDGARWLCDVRGVELTASLEELVSAKLGQAVSLR